MRKSIKNWFPIKNIEDGIIHTKNKTFCKIIEVCPINFELKSKKEQENILYKYLKESGLENFNKKFSKLTKVWFMGEESDEVTEQMADYVILSGAYGTDINYYVNGVLRMGMSENKNEYFIKRLFPPYETMCYRYPV